MEGKLVESDGKRLLGDFALKLQIQQLRQTDNWTNLLYLGRVYLLLAAVIGGTIAFDVSRAAAGYAWWCSLPVYLAAIVLVGAGQHHLSGLGHEASHHTLFRHRVLNDLLSDLLCMFPMYTSTHHYRLHHLAHHQFVNDPQRDPDIAQMKSSGHWGMFPQSRRGVLKQLASQLWVPKLFRFIRARAKYSTFGDHRNPYLRPGWQQPRWPLRVGFIYVALQATGISWLVWRGDRVWLAIVPGVLWLAMIGFFTWLPERYYFQCRIHPTISFRMTTLLRLTYITLLFCGLGWTTLWTGRNAALDYALLWVTPLLSSYAFFMVLRQTVQHANGDRGMLTNTRVFYVNPLLDFCIFPIGQRYHLPHHLYSTVPHYRLHQLHELLLGYPEYARQAVVVEGYLVPKRGAPAAPTVVDVLTHDYAPGQANEAYFDDSVLDQNVVEDKTEILREGRA